jgi:hypothetical protein
LLPTNMLGPCTRHAANDATGRQMSRHELLSLREAPKWRVISVCYARARAQTVGLDAPRNDPTSHWTGIGRSGGCRTRSCFRASGNRRARCSGSLAGQPSQDDTQGQVVGRWASGMRSVMSRVLDSIEGRWHALFACPAKRWV